MKIGTKVEIKNGTINFGGSSSGTAGYGIIDSGGSVQVKDNAGSWATFVQGTSGTSGVAGTSGSSGTSGNVGTSGSSGTSGTAGAAGASGTSGTSGPAGAAGTSGTSGVGYDGVYTGTSANNTSYPVGTVVYTAWNDTTYQDNATVSVYTYDNYYFTFRGSLGGSQLSGTWSNKGQIGVQDRAFAQRIA